MRIALPFLLIASTITLSGCITAVSQLSHVPQIAKELVWGKDVNLKEKNYAAADYLVQQASNRLHTYELTVIEPLMNLDAPQLTSQFAKTVPEQIAQRFVQLGYNIDLSQVANPHDVSFSTPSKGHAINVIKGTYTKENSGYRLDMRIVKDKTDTVISTFSYLIQYNSDINKLAEPIAIIKSIPSAQKMPQPTIVPMQHNDKNNASKTPSSSAVTNTPQATETAKQQSGTANAAPTSVQ